MRPHRVVDAVVVGQRFPGNMSYAAKDGVDSPVFVCQHVGDHSLYCCDKIVVRLRWTT